MSNHSEQYILRKPQTFKTGLKGPEKNVVTRNTLFRVYGVFSIIILLVATLILTVNYLQLGRLCPLYNITGIPCPSCGCTRAFILLFNGDIVGSVSLNPNALLATIAICLIATVFLLDFGLFLFPKLRNSMILPRLLTFVFESDKNKIIRNKKILISATIFLLFELYIWFRNISLHI